MKKNEKGQSLFEVLFATALAALIVTGVASVAVTSLRNAEFARNQSEARQTAQNMLEEARNFRDENSDAFFSNTNPDPTPICADGFDCSYQIDRSPDTATVTAIVEWTDGNGDHTVTSKTILTSWQN